MKKVKSNFILVCLLFVCFTSAAQEVDSLLFLHSWKAYWITVPGEKPDSYGVYLFRKHININAKPDSFVVHVSADNRYKLFVNEKLVSIGPVRGDLEHWNYETIDIASYLKSGENVIAAQVWNEGEWRPEAQISFRTGFVMQGNTSTEKMVNTDTSWKCIKDSSYQPIRFSVPAYYVAGPGEAINMNLHIDNWNKMDYKEDAWQTAKIISAGNPKNNMGGSLNPVDWMLVPSSLPQRELSEQRLLKARRTDGIVIPASFPSTKTSLTIPANKTVTLLLDQTFLTNAYPTLIFSGGKNATLAATYAEALFTKYPSKGNRNEIAGKIMLGRKDSILSNGKDNQEFTALSFRTYRYIQLQIVTNEQPLVLNDIYGTFTSYPFQLKAKIESGDSEINKMLDIGWRTARLCAWETYTDCPYYEQLQYIGDTRIQGLVSLYNSGDDRLLKNAINQMDNSRQPEGITESRHPSATPQYIPTFSLWYIGVLHDYMMYGKDTDFSKDKLHGERDVLTYFHHFQQPDGSLKNVPYWIFTDWVDAKDWDFGVGPLGKDGTSALLDLQLLWAYQSAADMESKLGMKDYASLYNDYAEQLKITIHNKYWDNTKKLFADRSEKDLFSQHTNALAILTGVAGDEEKTDIAKRLLTDTSLAPASIYFKYYLHQALIKAGLGNDYLSWLDLWRENIKMGLTTWAEISDINNARSDCHAWGASPNIEFYRTILGIDSDAPGFAKVKIEPHLGSLTNISGEMPHPNGTIAVSYQLKNNKWNIIIALPQKTSGFLVWNNKQYPLQDGINKLIL